MLLVVLLVLLRLLLRLLLLNTVSWGPGEAVVRPFYHHNSLKTRGGKED